MAQGYYEVIKEGSSDMLIVKIEGKNLIRYLGNENFFKESGAHLNEDNQLCLNSGYIHRKISDKVAEKKKETWNILGEKF